MSRQLALAAGGILLVVFARIVQAGPINPDISVVGQPFVRLTDDPASPEQGRARIDVGETEIVFDAYLNPYARGTFVASLAADGIELEEGYFSIFRSIPLGLQLKGGKYRVGFGHLNPAHPHALPFAERFRVLAAYLPGEESLNETGISLSRRFAVHGDFSLNAAADWLQGDTYRLAREPSGDPADPLANGGDDRAGESRPAFVGRLSGFAMLGEQSALDFGISATGGTNNVAAGSLTRVYGADAKAKLWMSPNAYLVLQGEGLVLEREDAAWDAVSGYTKSTVRPAGGYFFADYNFSVRYNVGASYERFQEPTMDKPWDQAVGAFAGYSLLEETTVFRGEWVRFIPATGDAFDTYTLRVIFSMGPHKAHQF
jgi:hypothetical protein